MPETPQVQESEFPNPITIERVRDAAYCILGLFTRIDIEQALGIQNPTISKKTIINKNLKALVDQEYLEQVGTKARDNGRGMMMVYQVKRADPEASGKDLDGDEEDTIELTGCSVELERVQRTIRILVAAGMVTDEQVRKAYELTV